MAYQTHDLITAIREDGIPPQKLKVDGGMVVNNWLMQFLSDILDIKISRPVIMETTALGAAYLCGLHAGLYENTDEIVNSWQLEKQFIPGGDPKERARHLENWQRAVSQAIVKTR